MRYRILVVAPDVMLRSTLARWLMSAGYSVELVESDTRAREVLANHRIAITIMTASGLGTGAAFDPGEKGGKLVILTEPQRDIGLPARSVLRADACLTLPLDKQDVLARL